MLPAVVTSIGMTKRWFTNVQTWRSRRKLKGFAWWERERAKGKARFVIRAALTYSLLMTAAEDLMGNSFAGAARFDTFLYNAIFFSLGGIFVGLVAWWDREKNYKNALHQIRIETAAAGESLHADQK